MKFSYHKAVFLFVLFICFSTSAQLQLKEIMKGSDFVGYLPENQRWDVNGERINFTWNPEKKPLASTYAFSIKTGKTIAVNSEEIVYFDPDQKGFNDVYFLEDGKLFVYQKVQRKKVLVLELPQPILNFQRLKNENTIALLINDNVFLLQVKGEMFSLFQLTRFKTGKAKKSEEIDSTFLEKQQTELFEFVRLKNEQSAYRKLLNPAKKDMTCYLGAGTIEEMQVDPSGKFVVVRMHEEANEPSTHYEDHITANGFTKSREARSKVSANEPNDRLLLFQSEANSLIELDFSFLTDIRKKPTFMRNSENDTFPKNRPLFIHQQVFNPMNTTSVFDVRSADNKDRWIVHLDLTTGKMTELEHQHDEAWIGGPGISSWNMENGTLGWLNDGKSIYFQSESSGFSHLYLLSVEDKKRTQLTSGNFEIHGVTLSNDGKRFYLSANKTHPGNRGFYSLEIATVKWMPILETEGAFEVAISPDEKQLAYRFSTSTQPWELYYCSNTLPSKSIQITRSTTTEFQAYKWRKPEVFSFKASDGVEVFARLYEPSSEKKNGAAVLFVHGAGYLQNAHHYWSTYFREYMFHNLLTDLGYTVLDVDYRASEGYGRDYRTAIYRHKGGRDLNDFVDAKAWLVKNKGIDAKRVGIYGGSYGGFITLMGLLTTPDEFACGAALRSVTDWAHYNHEYTSNILNAPETDPEAYRRSSPIYFADNLKKPLLILHGMVDDNVQFQDVVRLSQRFIELNKTKWELAVFPTEAHGFKNADSWFDEYRRILELFEKELK